MKRFLALATTAALLVGSTGISAYGSTFADINQVPWPGAATFIDQAASLGLMSGYSEDGKKYCKPRNNVTYCEATQLIYSIMKTYYKEDVSSSVVTKWQPIMEAYRIPSWAYNAVAYSLEKGFLVTSDLTKFMNGSTQQPANREDVGVLFGKALGKVYTVDMDATLSYADNASISKSAAPYLALLNSKKIMVGDDYNKFNPDVNINRSEMAVLSVKTYKQLTSDTSQSGDTTTTTPSNGSATGTVVASSVLENGNLFCSVRTSIGSGLNLFGVKGTAKAYYDGSEIDFSDIGSGDTVSLTYANGNIKTITVTKSANGIDSKETYDLEDITSTKVIVKDGSKEKSFSLASNVSVYLNEKSSSPSKLVSAMDDGDDLSVTLYFNSDNEVTKIYATAISDDPKTGLLTKLSDSSLTIKSDGKSYQYDVDDDVDVTDELTDLSFSDLKKYYSDTDYNVTLTTDSKGVVTKITVNYAEDDENGILTDVTSRKLTIEANGKDYTYDFASDVNVKVDGKTRDIDYLKDNYEDTSYRVALTIDRYDEVTDIVAIEESMGASEGIIDRITNSEIRIKDKDGDSHTYDLPDDTDDVDIKINGKSADFDELKDKYKDYKYSAKLSFKNKEVSKIEATNTEADEGELRNITEDEIKIRVDDSNFTYELSNSVDIEVDGDDYDLDDFIDEFNDGENFDVKLTFNSSNTKVTKIKAEYASSKRNVEGDLDDISSSWIKVDGEKYYLSDDFDEEDDISGDVDDYQELRDRFEEDGDDFEIELKLDSSGDVTSIEAKEA